MSNSVRRCWQALLAASLVASPLFWGLTAENAHAAPAAGAGRADPKPARSPSARARISTTPPRAGDEIIGPHRAPMVWVPGGTFTAGKAGNLANGLHEVTLPGFWIDKYEVTNEMFVRFLNRAAQTPLYSATPRSRATGEKLCEITTTAGIIWQGDQSDPHGGRFACHRGEERSPVRFIYPQGAEEFADHFELVLPTSAEWEYVARGALSLTYPWGNEWDTGKCCNAFNRLPNGTVREVGTVPGDVSWCGAHDLAGNVEEITATRHGEDQLLRGGSWLWRSVPDDFDCSRFHKREPGYTSAGIGFRCVWRR